MSSVRAVGRRGSNSANLQRPGAAPEWHTALLFAGCPAICRKPQFRIQKKFLPWYGKKPLIFVLLLIRPAHPLNGRRTNEGFRKKVAA